MANIKQRFIKPGRDYNYSEGVKVLADTAVYADQIVYVTSSSGPFLKVATADADGVGTARGRLLIAKHDIAIGAYGIALPWKLVTGFNTNAKEVGDPVFLHETPGTTTASNLTLTAPTGDAKVVVVGRITIKHATTGAILVHADAPEERVQGGTIAYDASAQAVVGRPMEQVRVTLPADTTNVDMTFPYAITITDVKAISAGASTAAAATVQNGTGGNEIVTPFAFGAITVLTYPVAYIAANLTVAAGTVLRVTKSATGTVADLIIVSFIRA